jgi:tagatose-6-phosphate ketose/aldose isomerase
MSQIEDPAALGAAATTAEIAHQPAMWRRLGLDLGGSWSRVRDFLDPLLALPQLRIVLTGAGTSAFAGQVLAPGLARTRQRRVDALATTDIVSNPGEAFAHDVPTLVVSFARSGDSPESLAAVRLANDLLTRVHHLIITCSPDGALARECPPESLVLVMPDGTNDRSFAMTSSFTTMLLAARLVLSPAGDPGDLTGRLALAAEPVLAVMSGPDGLAATLARRGYDRVVFLGSGALTGLARESALKLTELTAGRVPAWADSALGFRHGPKAVLTPQTLVVVYLSNDLYTRRYDQDIAAELLAQLGPDHVLVVGGPAGPESGLRVVLNDLTDVDDAALAAPMVIVAQSMALRFSLALGIGPDNPFPGGQVNRVVQGVTVHALPA